MEKNRIRPVKSGKSMRMSYSRQKEVLEMPNLIEVQKDSYQWFLNEGLKEVFSDISPIADYNGRLSLEFVDFALCEEERKYSIEECKERDATYAAPLKVRVRLHNKESEDISEHEIFMGENPIVWDDDNLVIKVNCKREAGNFREAIPYCLFVSFEVAEGFDVDLYTEVTAKIRQRVQVPNN